jgi:predicted phage terminase large subunit-like protein
MNREQTKRMYSILTSHAQKLGQVKPLLRKFGREDLFFLLVNLLNRQDADNDWSFDRCREVEAAPDGFLDLWPREHYKSTIITFALGIQRILRDPETTIGIFSFNRPAAKKALRQIKTEFETNAKLRDLYPEILYADPKKESPKWSEDDGIVVRRKGNPKEATVEAWGLVDGQPTGAHFRHLMYDDVVTKESVTTPDMIRKVTESFALSLNLGAKGGTRAACGTRYHYNDTYAEMGKRGTFEPRLYAATKDGTLEGEPWLLTRAELAKKVVDFGPYVAACQLFNKPEMDSKQGFKKGWLRYWPANHYNALNLYLLLDPANEKKVENDYSCFMVVGLGADQNYYIVDMVRDRLSLTERTNVLFKLHQTYRPKATGIERYGKDADIQHYQDRMSRDNYRFPIIETGGPMPKNDRIKQLVPYFEQGRVYLPERCVRVNYEGVSEDLSQAFVNDEYAFFPFAPHDDMMDCLARIMDPDLGATFPRGDASDPHGFKRSIARKPYEPLEQPL